MSGVNKVIIVGNLGGDPDVTATKSGAPVCTLSVAVNKSWKDKSTGERREHVEWIRVVIFNEGLVEVAKKYLHKGSKVYVEGEFRTRKWTDQNKIERWMTEVVLSAFGSVLVLLDRAEKVPAPSESDYGRQAASAASSRDALDDEIPF